MNIFDEIEEINSRMDDVLKISASSDFPQNKLERFDARKWVNDTGTRIRILTDTSQKMIKYDDKNIRVAGHEIAQQIKALRQLHIEILEQYTIKTLLIENREQ